MFAFGVWDECMSNFIPLGIWTKMSPSLYKLEMSTLSPSDGKTNGNSKTTKPISQEKNIRLCAPLWISHHQWEGQPSSAPSSVAKRTFTMTFTNKCKDVCFPSLKIISILQVSNSGTLTGAAFGFLPTSALLWPAEPLLMGSGLPRSVCLSGSSAVPVNVTRSMHSIKEQSKSGSTAKSWLRWMFGQWGILINSMF